MRLELGVDVAIITRIERVFCKFGIRFLERFLLPSEILMAHKKRESFCMQNISDSLPNHLPVSLKSPFFLHEDYLAYQYNSLTFLQEIARDCQFNMQTIAGMWAMKEACAKALGDGIGKVLSFHDICIFKDLKGKPHIALHEEKFRIYMPKNIAISVSHDDNRAIAVCAICFNE